MRKYLRHIVVVLLLLLLGVYSCELDKINSCPCIRSIEQPTARSGDTITLNGDFLNFDTSDVIKIDGKDTGYRIVGSQILAEVPQNITSEKVSVVLDLGGCDNTPEICENSFDYKMVTVTDVDIVKAKHGTEIKISGTNFRESGVDANIVSFNGVVGIVKSANDTVLVVEVPVGAKSGPISVEVDGFKSSSTENFTYEFTATVSLFAGTFGTPGPGPGGSETSQLFDTPTGIDVFTSSSDETFIYVADTGNHVIRKITSAGQVSLFAGVFSMDGGYEDTLNSMVDAAEFKSPEDVVADASGNVFVTESGNYTVRKVSPMGTMVGTIAGSPDSNVYVDNTFGIDARFESPKGITIAKDSLIHISDRTDHRIRIINTNTTFVSTLAGNGNIDPDNGFNSPRGLTYNSINDIAYVADFNSQRIRFITSSGDVETVPNEEVIIPPNLQFSAPSDIAIDMDGNIYFIDAGDRNQIKRIDGNTNKVTLVTTGASGGQPPFNRPSGIAYDTENDIIYVADGNDHVIRKIILR